MDKQTRAQLEANGWRLDSVAEFLDLTPEESAFVEMRLALADHLRKLRTDRGWTQTQTATHLGSSQSRLAKMEAADRSVSLDLLIKAHLALGASPAEIGRVIATQRADDIDRVGIMDGGIPDSRRAVKGPATQER